MNGQEFINELSRRLRDVTKKQWDDEFLTSALNAAMGALTATLPQAYTVNRTLTLSDGVEQVIDVDLHRIVTLLHNVSDDGTPRRAVTEADMSVFDAAYPQWRQDLPRAYVRHWMTDEYDESKFYVWPPATEAHKLRGTFTQTPYIDLYAEPGADKLARPAIPEFMLAPVDPGPLGTDGDIAEAGVYQGVTTADGLIGFRGVLFIDPDLADTNTRQVPLNEYIDIIMPAYDPSWPQSSYASDLSLFTQFVAPDYQRSINTQCSLKETDGSANLDINDPRLAAGNVVRISRVQNQEYRLAPESAGSYIPGTTQAMMDAYNAQRTLYDAYLAQLDQYAIDLEAYNAQNNIGIRPLPDPVGPEPIAPTDRSPVFKDNDSSNVTLSADKLTANHSSSSSWATTVINDDGRFSSGKLVWDYVGTGANTGTTTVIGMVRVDLETNSASSFATYLGNTSPPFSFGSFSTGTQYHNKVTYPNGISFNNSDRMRVLVDLDAGTYSLQKNDDAPVLIFSNVPAGTYVPALTTRSSSLATIILDRSQMGDIPEGYRVPGELGAYPQVDTPLLTQYDEALLQYDAQVIAFDAALFDRDSAIIANAIASVQSTPPANGAYSLTDTLPIKRAHYQALQEFAMYYAYSIDDDLTANSGRAQRHWLAFFQLLNKREDANLMIGAAQDVTE